jgi:hypothetical protein
MPMQQLQGLGGMGLNNAQLMQNAQMNNANLYAQLGLGGITADTNYGNMLGNAFGNMVTAGSGLLGGIGGRMDQAGGIGGVWDMIKGLF